MLIPVFSKMKVGLATGLDNVDQKVLCKLILTFFPRTMSEGMTDIEDIGVIFAIFYF